MSKAGKTSASGLRRPGSGYRYGQHGVTGSSKPEGDLTLQASADVSLMRPKFGASGPMIFRPLPCMDEDGNLMSCRYTANEYDFTDWIRSYPAARYVGIGEPQNHFTFLLYDAQDETARSSNPYVTLQRALWRAKEAGSLPDASWLPLIDGRNKAVPKADDLTFMQALVFEHNEESYGRQPKGIAPTDKTPVIQLPKSASRVIVDMLNEINESYKEDDENWDKMFKYGDPVALESGRFFCVYNPQKYNPDEHEGRVNRPAASADEDVDLDWSSSNSRNKKGRGGDDDVRGYMAKILERHTVDGGRISPKLVGKEDMVKRLIRPWDSLIRIPAIEEQCMFIARALSTVPKLVHFGWGDHPEFFTDEVNGILKSRTQSMGGRAGGEELAFEDEEPKKPTRRETSSAISTPDDAFGVEPEDDEIEATEPDADDPATDDPAEGDVVGFDDDDMTSSIGDATLAADDDYDDNKAEELAAAAMAAARRRSAGRKTEEAETKPAKRGRPKA